MARSLVGGLIRAGTPATSLAVGEPNGELAAGLIRDFGIEALPENAAVVRGAATWVLAIKPQVMKTVCTSLRDIAQTQKPLVISIAAGIRSDQIEQWLGGNIAIVQLHAEYAGTDRRRRQRLVRQCACRCTAAPVRRNTCCSTAAGAHHMDR